MKILSSALFFLSIFGCLFAENLTPEQPLAQFGNDSKFLPDETAKKSSLKSVGEEKLVYILNAKDANISRDPLDPNGKILKLYGINSQVVSILNPCTSLENTGFCTLTQFQSVWQKSFPNHLTSGNIIYLLEEHVADSGEFFHQIVQIKELQINFLAGRITCKITGPNTNNLHLGDLGPTTLLVGDSTVINTK
ncbi:MAG: hypothetical protein WCP39_01570 [Chlamydiota bacterium]